MNQQLAMSLIEAILQCFEEAGVEYVFGVPGGAVEPIYNALARSGRRGGPRAVVARHESGAAFMADGYARETGKLGVCLATSGPGATNLITGVACAYENNVPLLALTGQPADRKAAGLSRADRAKLVQAAKRLRVPVTGTLGFEKAEVTAGGVSLDEVDSRTMQSKRHPGLYLAGEVLDLDGWIGGYNFQSAWSTGWLAGRHV